jgi:hypothetical protein
MPLRVAYRRVLGIFAQGLFKNSSKSAVWLRYLGPPPDVLEPNCFAQTSHGTSHSVNPSAPSAPSALHPLRLRQTVVVT